MKKLASLHLFKADYQYSRLIYLCLPELWLRMFQPHFLVLIPNERIMSLKSEDKLLEMPEKVLIKQKENY